MENCIMKRLTSQGWETLRTLTAITAAIGTMICLLILAGCTNELTGQDENRGNGQALTLGTVSIEGGNSRAANAVPGVASGHSFRDDEKLHVALTAGSAQSAGTYYTTATTAAGVPPRPSAPTGKGAATTPSPPGGDPLILPPPLPFTTCPPTTKPTPPQGAP